MTDAQHRAMMRQLARLARVILCSAIYLKDGEEQEHQGRAWDSADYTIDEMEQEAEA